MYGSALVIAARLRSGTGDLAEALQRSREAIDYSHRVSDISNASFAPGNAAITLAAHARYIVAAEIMGAVEGGVTRALSGQWARAEGDRRQSARRAAEAALGETAFDAAWSRGAAMTLDEIAAVAIAALDELLAAENPTA